jgi:uncharacterized pyridoxamine 5'-phosphate oxidase family protein
MDGTINLKGLLSVIVSEKPITINLYNEKNLLLITFVLPGYPYLEDVYEEDQVTRIEIKNLSTLNITIDTSANP